MLQKNKTKSKRKSERKSKTQTRTKTKSRSKTNKHTSRFRLYKQNGSSFMNNITGSLFTNTNTQTQSINKPDLINIIYNRNTPKMIMINSSSPHTIYQSSLLQTVPHIQMKDYNSHYDNHYLLLIVLPGEKPQLLWAIDIKGGAKSKSILDYDLPKYKVGLRFKILFKLHKYNKNIKETFTVANNITKERHTVFNELKTYLTKNNMLNALFFKEVDIVQDKGQTISQFLSFLAK